MATKNKGYDIRPYPNTESNEVEPNYTLDIPKVPGGDLKNSVFSGRVPKTPTKRTTRKPTYVGGEHWFASDRHVRYSGDEKDAIGVFGKESGCIKPEFCIVVTSPWHQVEVNRVFWRQERIVMAFPARLLWSIEDYVDTIPGLVDWDRKLSLVDLADFDGGEKESYYVRYETQY